MIAAETTGRACFGLELNPAYVDVIIERWQQFTGEAALLEAQGRAFEEVRTARRTPETSEATA